MQRKHVPFATTNSYAPPSGSSNSRSTRLHLLLDYSTSSIIYDFVDHPSVMLSSTRRDRISSRKLGEPATSPARQSMTLRSTNLPWKVQVRASNGSFVTVMDVINAIYNSLRMTVDDRELHEHLPIKTDRDRARVAHRERCKRYRNSTTYDNEKRRGLRRIDFLMGHSKFRGLSGTDSASEWFFNFA